MALSNDEARAIVRKRRTHEEVARQLGVTRGRVGQLVSAGELTDLSEQGVREFANAREKKKADREAYKKAQDEKREAERQEVLTAINRVDRHLLMMAAALALKGVSESL